MPTPQLPINPTSYHRTGMQIALMLLMAFNYLVDHNPRHIQYAKDQRAKRKAEKQQHRHKPGFVVELPDEEGKTCNQSGFHATRTHVDDRPHSPCRKPPPVSRDGKEAWPFARGRSHLDRRVDGYNGKDISGQAPRANGRLQMRDAWTRMRAVSRTPYEYVRRADGRKKRVSFNRDVQWFVIDGDEDGDGDEHSGEHWRGRR